MNAASFTSDDDTGIKRKKGGLKNKLRNSQPCGVAQSIKRKTRSDRNKEHKVEDRDDEVEMEMEDTG